MSNGVRWVSVILTLISIGIAIYFYTTSQRSRNPVYKVSDAVGQVYDSDVASPAIRLVDSTGSEIEGDVYLATITFWNAGELPVEPDHVRTPVRLRLKNATEVIDYSVVAQTRPDVTDFGISVDDTASTPTLRLTWDHLDPNHGARVQVMYRGDRDPNVELAGYILGVDDIRRTQPLKDSDSEAIEVLGMVIGMFGGYTLFFVVLMKVPNRIMTRIFKVPLMSRVFQLLAQASSPESEDPNVKPTVWFGVITSLVGLGLLALDKWVLNPSLTPPPMLQ